MNLADNPEILDLIAQFQSAFLEFCVAQQDSSLTRDLSFKLVAKLSASSPDPEELADFLLQVAVTSNCTQELLSILPAISLFLKIDGHETIIGNHPEFCERLSEFLFGNVVDVVVYALQILLVLVQKSECPASLISIKTLAGLNCVLNNRLSCQILVAAEILKLAIEGKYEIEWMMQPTSVFETVLALVGNADWPVRLACCEIIAALFAVADESLVGYLVEVGAGDCLVDLMVDPGLSESVICAVDVIFSECGPDRFPELVDGLQEIAEDADHPHCEAANSLLLRLFPPDGELD
jgi:hypothetical protein